ncbi:MAG: hypothetical protein HFG22_17450 [Lachnospiraceae bacterium]|nr:hypothetical protein [Lachnospiraceae bacterium]
MIRCTAKEKEKLKRLAGKGTVSGYLRDQAFKEGPEKTLRDLMPETLKGIGEMDMLLRMIDGSTDTELREKVMGMFPKREWKAGSDAKRDIVQ